MATMNNRSAKRVPGVPSPAYIESLYRTMAAALGPTGWWPAETTFEIMVGAVLTQNTAWGNVNRSLAALNAEGVLEPHKLAIMGPSASAGTYSPVRLLCQQIQDGTVTEPMVCGALRSLA